MCVCGQYKQKYKCTTSRHNVKPSLVSYEESTVKFEILRIYVLFCCIEELMKNALFERRVREKNTEDLLPYQHHHHHRHTSWYASKTVCITYKIEKKKNLCGGYGGCGVCEVDAWSPPPPPSPLLLNREHIEHV